MRIGSPRPLERERGRDSFAYLEYVGFRLLTSILSLLQGRGEKPDAVAWARRRFFKVPVMALIAFVLKRPFYTAMW
jgi:hypothetical protein